MDKNQWVSIFEYSRLNGVSISTIRRNIKSNKIPYQKINGKYLLESKQSCQAVDQKCREELKSKLEMERLKIENRLLTEKVYELQMLVKIYEGQIRAREEQLALPDLPEEVM